MFDLETHAIPAMIADLLESARVDDTGYIFLPDDDDAREIQKGKLYNTIDVILVWANEETFGMQFVSCTDGSSLSQKMWVRRYAAGFANDAIARRKADIRRMFAPSYVAFEVLGWRLSTTRFWVPPRGTIKTAASTRTKVTALPHGKRNLH